MTLPQETGDVFPHARVTNRSGRSPERGNKWRGRYLRSDRAFESAVITERRVGAFVGGSAHFSCLSCTNFSGVMDERCVICPENLVPSGQGEERDGDGGLSEFYCVISV